MWAVLTLFTPHVSLASGSTSGYTTKDFYVGVQYKPAMHHLSSFIIKEDSNDTLAVFALKKGLTDDVTTSIKTGTNFSSRYIPSYEDNYLGFSGMLGYHHNNNLRIESEISSQVFHIKNEGYKVLDHEKHFALARELSNGTPTNEKYVTLINNGIVTTSILVNACYDIQTDIYNVKAYSCIGFGAGLVDFLSQHDLKLSYQGKLGLSYPVSPKITVFVEGYYHGLLGKNFNNIPVNYPKAGDNHSPEEKPKLTTASAVLNVRHYGGGIGLRFIL